MTATARFAGLPQSSHAPGGNPFLPESTGRRFAMSASDDDGVPARGTAVASISAPGAVAEHGRAFCGSPGRNGCRSVAFGRSWNSVLR